MSSKIYIKRTSVPGKVPTTSNINTGELALNLADGRLYSANSSAVFEIGSNVHSLSVGAGGFSIGNGTITFPTSDGTNGQVLTTNGTGTLSFQDPGGAGSTANSFSVIEVGGTLVKATGSTQRLSLDAGSGITLTPTDANNTIVISASGVGGGFSSLPSTKEYEYVATAGQTSFSGADTFGQTLNYSAGYITVFLNGTKLVSNTDYVATDGSTLVLQDAAANTDLVSVIAYGATADYITANSETSSTAAALTVDTFPVASTRTAKYLVQVQDNEVGNRYQASEVLLIHNGSAVFLTEYATVNTSGAPLAFIDADIDTGNVRLRVTPTYANSTIKTVRTTIGV